MFISIKAFSMAAAFLGSSHSISEENSSAAPPQECKIDLGSLCFLENGVSFSKIYDRAKYTTWMISGPTWHAFPLYVYVPRKCQDKHSDVITLLDSGLVDSNRMKWNRIKVRLLKKGSCDIDLFAPSKMEDPQAAAFYSALSGIRICRERKKHPSCFGPRLGDSIGTFLKPR